MAFSPFPKRSNSQDMSPKEGERRSSNLSSSQQQRLRDTTSPKLPSSLSKSNTIRSISSTSSANASALAKQYESDRQNLIKYCFSAYDNDNVLVESYITHVRIIEDAMYVSTRPPSNSAPDNKKQRILVLAVKKDGIVNLHKGRENSNGTFQIGRTWSLNDLVSIKRDLKVDTGFQCNLGKDYYWETNSSRERQVFVGSLIRTYRKFKQGLLPILINWDLATFGLDEESYKLFLNQELVSKVISSPKKKPEIALPPAAESSRISSPEKTAQVRQEPTAIKAAVPSDGYSIEPQTTSSDISKEAVDIQNPAIKRSTSKVALGSTPEAAKPKSANVQTDLKKQPYPQPSMRLTFPLVQQRSSLSPKIPPQQQASPYDQTKNASKSSTSSLVRSRSMLLDDDVLPPAPKASSPIVAQTLVIDDEPLSRSPQKQSESQPETYRKSLDPKKNSPEYNIPLPDPQGSYDDLNSYPSNELQDEDLNVNTNLTRIATSAHDVEIFTHTKSSREEHDLNLENDYPEKELQDHNVESMHYDYQDDITDLYDDTLEEEEGKGETNRTIPQKAPPKIDLTGLQFAHQDQITPLEQTPSIVRDDTGDFSYDDSQEITDRQIDQSHEYESVGASVLDSSDETSQTDAVLPERLAQAQTQRYRANSLASLDSGLPKESTQESEYDDIFDQINWDPTDDSTTIMEKLNAELTNIEYETTKSLIKISEGSNNMKSSYERILNECEKLTPIFEFFSVELSGFANDIKDVEFEGKGLQVKTSNKKKLWNDLQTLLNTISVDEKSLSFLLHANIDKDTVNIEAILSELESAILAIRGDKNKDDDLAEMKALRERGDTYENFLKTYIANVKEELDQRFKHVLGNLSKTENPEHSVLKGELAKLLVYSGITLFVKNVSKEKISELSLVWQNDINPYYMNQLTFLSSKIHALVAEGNDGGADAPQAKYSLVNPPKLIISKASSPAGDIEQQDKLRGQFRLDENIKETQFNEVGSQTTLYQYIIGALKSLALNIMTQQEFLFKFFHMNNEALKMTDFRERFPIQSRDRMLLQSGKEVEAVDTNRSLAREVYHSIHNIFQPHLDKFIKLLGNTLKYHENYTPLVLTHLQISLLRLNVTDQEFTSHILKKLEEKLTNDWLRFVGSEIGLIEKNSLANKKVIEVSNIVKNFTKLIEDIDFNFKNIIKENQDVDLEKLHVRELINDSNNQFTKALLANLQNELNSLTNSDTNAIKTSTQNYDINEVSDSKFKYNQIVNIVQNSNYLLDSITTLRLPQFNDFLNSIRVIFNKSRDLYIGILMESLPQFNKVVNFVKDVEEYLKESNRNLDPSRRNAYSKQTLDKLVHDIDVKYVNNMISQLRREITQDFIGNNIGVQSNETKMYQKSLIDKVWSSLQAEYVGVFINLESIIDKFYKDVGLRFSKKDLINAFNNARITC